jgi:hypothetical protein
MGLRLGVTVGRRALVGSVCLALLLVAVRGFCVDPEARAEVIPPSIGYEADLASPDGYPTVLRTEGQTVEIAVEGEDLRVRRRGGQFVALYSTKGKVGEHGISASFGALGRLDLEFTPSPTDVPHPLARFGRSSTREPVELPSMPAPTCRGRHGVDLEGELHGALDFEGRGGWVQIHRPTVEASFSRSFRQVCTYEGAARQDLGLGGGSLPEVLKGGGWQHTVIAHRPLGRGEVFFMDKTLTRDEGRESEAGFLDAGFLEFHEGVRLLEHDFFEAPADFRLRKRGTDWRRVTLAPPAPFSGAATITRAARGEPPRLRGSLRISLPGVPDLALTGKDFRADICGPRGEFRCEREFYR